MSIGGALAKAGGKIAAKAGIGAAAGSAVPGIGNAIGGAVGLGLGAVDVIALIKDIAANGPTPEKVAAVKAQRDALAEKLMVAQKLSREDAMAAANEQLRPALEEANKPASTAGDIAGDLAGIAIGGGLLYKARKGMRAAKAGVDTVERGEAGRAIGGRGPTATDIEESNRASIRGGASDPARGATAAAAAPDPTYQPGFKSRGREMAETGQLDRVSAEPASGGIAGYLPGPDEVREGVVVPDDGGTMPMNLQEVMRMLLSARARQMPRRPARMAGRLGLPGPMNSPVDLEAMAALEGGSAG